LGILTIDEVQPGMVLAADLFGSNGRFLLPGGAVVEERHLRVFRIWGVVEVDVEDVPGAEEPGGEAGIDPEVLARAETLEERRFRLADLSHPAVQAVFKVAVRRRARMLAKGEHTLPGDEAPEEAAYEASDVIDPGDLVRRQSQLASYPDIYMRIVEVLNNPRSSASHIAEVVGKDASVSAKLLRLVNSPFYGFPSRIDTLSRAVALIGANELSTLALGISVVNTFKGISPELLDMREFWKHSVACGVIARILSTHKIGLTEERFFVAGLLHDIAKLVMYNEMPLAMAAGLGMTASGSMSQHEAERMVVGYDHTVVGEMLLKEWRLPPALEKMIRHHHSPSARGGVLEAAIIHIADLMTIGLFHGNSGNPLVPALDESAWNGLSLSPGVIPVAAKQAERQIREILGVFLEGAS
jgi:putative nucleotidyltransferase with HDIG domain